MNYDTKNHTIWVEKYRPDTLDGYIGNEKLKAKLAQYIADADLPHLLLIGPPGTGKTTAAKILLRGIDCDQMTINASDENNIDTVRNKIRGFASTMGFRPLKIMFLDEFDGFTPQGQAALRNLMEQFSLTTRFILTANYVERIIDPIISRTQLFEVIPPSKRDAAMHVAGILRKENVTFTVPDLKIVLDAHFPDIRKIIQECQQNTQNGTLSIDQASVIESDFKLKIVDILKSKDDKKTKFQTIRQLLANASVRDYSSVYRVLFDRVTEYAGENIAMAILAINEGQFWDATVIDKEINCMATLLNVINL